MPQRSVLETIFPMGPEKVEMGFCIAYGRTYTVPGGRVGRHLQLVLPASLVKNVLEGLHSTLVGGHMGAAKNIRKSVRPILLAR